MSPYRTVPPREPDVAVAPARWWERVQPANVPVAMRAACAALLLAAAPSSLGCSSLGPAKASSNTLRTALHEAAPVLEERCIRPYADEPDDTEATSRAKLLAYDRSGCSKYLRAYDAALASHVALVATIGATEVGACVNSRTRECDMPRALLEAARASAAIAGVVRALRGEK